MLHLKRKRTIQLDISALNNWEYEDYTASFCHLVKAGTGIDNGMGTNFEAYNLSVKDVRIFLAGTVQSAYDNVPWFNAIFSVWRETNSSDVI